MSAFGRFRVGFIGLVLCHGCAAFAATGVAANDGSELWRDVDEADIAARAPRQIVPSAYRAVTLNVQGMRVLLAAAALEDGAGAAQSALQVPLPMPDGRFARFRIVESPIMAPALASKFPLIRTYLGQGIDDPSASVRFDLTPAGFHAQILTAGGTFYVDPYQPGDDEHHIAYARGDYSRDVSARSCEVIDADGPKSEWTDIAAHFATPKISSGSTLRTYRLALAATGEYTAFHGGTVAAGMAGIVTTMNRVNGIYEREVAVRMVLVANNDLIVYTDGLTDPYTNNNGSTMLGQNQTNLNLVIGNANYDIGHVFSTGGGGVASLGSVCSTANKARGVTGLGSPTGDAFDVDYVAHEMGHQFNAPHSFNSAQNSCSGGNRSAGSAYETGSGITIMAYAGICGVENLQPNSEDYFHRTSLNSILTFVSSGCAVNSATGNTPPVVTTPASFNIPRQTPFALTASGSDADNDTLTYLWEQFNLGASTTGGGALVDDGLRPIFPPLDPVLGSSRVFPALRHILASANVPPPTAPLPGTVSPAYYTGEILPSTNRTLNFRVTVRDNRAGGGGTNEASTALTVTTTAGPFAVTAPNTALTWAAGSAQVVTWAVANTDVAPVSAANVRITLSVNGGQTFPIELLASTSNNGTANVTVPANTPATTLARVRVEAVGNVFFDISDADFSISVAGNTPPSIVVTGSVSTRQGSPSTTAAVATVSDMQDTAGSLLASVTGEPPELSVSVANVAGTINLTATAGCDLVAPTSGNKVYPLQLTVQDSQGGIAVAQLVVNVARNLLPTLGIYSDQSLIRGGSTSATPAAAPADPNNNLAMTMVTPSTLPGGGTLSIAPDGVVSVNTTVGTTPGTYPVRASAVDTCGGTVTRQFLLTVITNNPVFALLGSSTTSGNNIIEPNECNTFEVTLANTGVTAATAISSTLSSTTPGVFIAQNISPYSDMGPAGSATNSSTFQIGTNNAVACQSSIALTQTLFYAGGGSPTTLNFVVPVGQAASSNYRFAFSTGATLGAGGTLVAGSQFDNAAVAITTPAGFDFSVFGTTINGGSTITASTNGTLQLAATGSFAWTNAALPVATGDVGSGSFPATSPTIFAYWDDLSLAGASNGIYTQLSGIAPNRTYRIEWRGITVTDANPVNFAVLLREGSNAMDLVYSNSAAANGSSATIGVQAAATGTAFTQYAFNATTVAAGVRLAAIVPAAICTVGPGTCAVLDVLFANGFEP